MEILRNLIICALLVVGVMVAALFFSNEKAYIDKDFYDRLKHKKEEDKDNNT